MLMGIVRPFLRATKPGYLVRSESRLRLGASSIKNVLAPGHCQHPELCCL